METTTREISNSDDVIDVRDIIARVEELEEMRDAETEKGLEPFTDSEDAEELATLTAFLADMAGNGGDEKWRGDWYPVTLVRDSYFEDYAQELADELGLIPSDARWPATCIDWEQAARELQQDYTTSEFGGVTYWYR